jgi:hypothetical protein
LPALVQSIAAVNELQRGNLTVGEARVRASVRWIRVDVIGTPLCGPRMLIWRALAHVEDCAAAHVVVDDAVGQSIQLVALAHELAADCVHFGGSQPVCLRLLLNPIGPQAAFAELFPATFRYSGASPAILQRNSRTSEKRDMIDDAVAAAEGAFGPYSELSPPKIAAFLDRIAGDCCAQRLAD